MTEGTQMMRFDPDEGMATPTRFRPPTIPPGATNSVNGPSCQSTKLLRWVERSANTSEPFRMTDPHNADMNR